MLVSFEKKRGNLRMDSIENEHEVYIHPLQQPLNFHTNICMRICT